MPILFSRNVVMGVEFDQVCWAQEKKNGTHEEVPFLSFWLALAINTINRRLALRQGLSFLGLQFIAEFEM